MPDAWTHRVTRGSNIFVSRDSTFPFSPHLLSHDCDLYFFISYFISFFISFSLDFHFHTLCISVCILLSGSPFCFSLGYSEAAPSPGQTYRLLLHSLTQYYLVEPDITYYYLVSACLARALPTVPVQSRNAHPQTLSIYCCSHCHIYPIPT